VRSAYNAHRAHFIELMVLAKVCFWVSELFRYFFGPAQYKFPLPRWHKVVPRYSG